MGWLRDVYVNCQSVTAGAIIKATCLFRMHPHCDSLNRGHPPPPPPHTSPRKLSYVYGNMWGRISYGDFLVLGLGGGGRVYEVMRSHLRDLQHGNHILHHATTGLWSCKYEPRTQLVMNCRNPELDPSCYTGPLEVCVNLLTEGG